MLEDLVATLAGLEHLQEISRAAHPLAKDRAVAHAWGQPEWADYSGVSRTLSRLTMSEAQTIAELLTEVGQPFIDEEVQLLRQQGQRLCQDGDLTGLPVSNTSRTYPAAAFGHMNNEIRLGYQAALVSLDSPTYGRLWLTAEHHPGDTVSSTQAEALVQAAEKRLGVRPRRRTELVQSRLTQLGQGLAQLEQRLSTAQQALSTAQSRLAEAKQQIVEQQRQVQTLAERY